MIRAPQATPPISPQEQDGLQWDELRSFVGSAALYFDFAWLVSPPKNLPNRRQIIPCSNTRVSKGFGLRCLPCVPSQSHHTETPMSCPVPQSTVP